MQNLTILLIYSIRKHIYPICCRGTKSTKYQLPFVKVTKEMATHSSTLAWKIP